MHGYTYRHLRRSRGKRQDNNPLATAKSDVFFSECFPTYLPDPTCDAKISLVNLKYYSYNKFFTRKQQNCTLILILRFENRNGLWSIPLLSVFKDSKKLLEPFRTTWQVNCACITSASQGFKWAEVESKGRYSELYIWEDYGLPNFLTGNRCVFAGRKGEFLKFRHLLSI
jgi:hypothetical protein